MPPVRVVHLGPDPAGEGGMPAVVRDLLASPLAREWAMSALPTYRQEAAWRRHRLAAGAALRLVAWCLRPGERIVHVHSAVRGSLYRKSVYVELARLLRRPVLLHLHAGAGDIADFDARIGPVSRWAFRRAFGRADRVISVSGAGAREIEERFGASGVLVVPNAAPAVPGVPVAPEPGRTGCRVLYLGGFADPAKGGAVLVEALARLDPGVEVVLAGPGTPPNLPAPHRWRGWLAGDAKHVALAAADVVVLPSVSEGLPVALLEAMAHGRAIVATAVGGMPEVLTDGEDAVLVGPSDPDALARALSALASDPARRERLGEAARRRAARLNDVEVTARLDALYRELLAR